MHVRRSILKVQGAPNEACIAALSCLPKSLELLRLRIDRGLVRARNVDATKENCSTSVVNEMGVGGVNKMGRDRLPSYGRNRRDTRHWRGGLYIVSEKKVRSSLGTMYSPSSASEPLARRWAAGTKVAPLSIA